LRSFELSRAASGGCQEGTKPSNQPGIFPKQAPVELLAFLTTRVVSYHIIAVIHVSFVWRVSVPDAVQFGPVHPHLGIQRIGPDRTLQYIGNRGLSKQPRSR